MKIHKMFCVDEELVDYLKGKNGSELVNGLLHERMGKDRLDGLNEEQCKAELEIIRLKKEVEEKSKEIRQNAGITGR